MSLLSTDPGTLSDVVAAHERLLVLFWAPWCHHCRNFRPRFEHMAAANPDIAFAGFQIGDDEASQAVLDDLGLTAIPSLLVFQGGQWIDSHSGDIPDAEFGELVGRLRTAPVPAL
ncbi:MAG: thioredoxin family protein [Propionibacteriaceae bacterium]|jgi:thioredoxin-like negative regulator of GroEL|nr:thioredoxin family protein [Propionibacteriaceae bacterium]